MVASTMDLLGWLRKHLEQADSDLLRELVTTFVQALMGAEADAACGAGHGERTPERVTQRNGHRARVLTTSAGDLELRIPKLAMRCVKRRLGGAWASWGGSSAGEEPEPTTGQVRTS